ncbi:vWA domain-containing protein [Rhizobium herbae]|uniref:Flp pilus assembly protein TadG n=1 Tax=Rhizobium herbae TaxID=508661 RepID=A0ABS4EMD8_9HYPH|nr:pilus assembly protein [Rhizobium herbae]MBP1859120.1 Flp pilus assembly protein TadG [Rhizobium herbae]
MAKRSTLLQSCSNLVGDRLGNFGMMTALLLPVLLASGGVAIDMTNMMMAKNHLQDATDAAALAASSALANQTSTQAEAKLMAKSFVKAQMQNWKSSSMTPEEQADFDESFSGTVVTIDEQAATVGLGNAKTYNVQVSSSFDVPLNAMTQLLGMKKTTISTTSKSLGSTEAKNALSMFLVLDRSGSMAWKTNAIDTTSKSCNTYQESNWPLATWSTPCYVAKIASLKLAVGNLLAQLKTADPDSNYVRTADVSYSSQKDTTGTLEWGTASALNYVNLLTAEGGTDSSGAFKAALAALTKTGKNSEEKIHEAKNGQTAPTKYIVFMTDGENNFYNGTNTKGNDVKSDNATKTACDSARTNKIEVFTVAFMAPTRGQTLLKYCATDANHYFQAEDSAALVAAFKAIGAKAADLSVRLTQ